MPGVRSDLWFHHISLPFRRRLRGRLRRAIKRTRKRNNWAPYTITHEKPAYQPAKLTKLDSTAHGRVARIGDKKVKLFNLRDLEAMYGLGSGTASRWYYGGLLPEPFIRRQAGRRGYEVLYTRAQMKVILMVLNDIFSQGVKQIQLRWMGPHKAMLEKGNALALESMEPSEKAQHREAFGDRFGIEWID